jgi:hypothetical protein
MRGANTTSILWAETRNRCNRQLLQGRTIEMARNLEAYLQTLVLRCALGHGE